MSDLPSKAEQRRMFSDNLHSACIHEAGHAIAAIYRGVPFAHARIYKRRDDVSWDETPYGGGVKWDTGGFPKLTHAIVGYAGCVAESLDQDIDLQPDEIKNSLEWGELEPSPSDWKSVYTVHPSWRERALTKTVGILKANFWRVRLVAGALIKDFRWHKQNGNHREESEKYMLLTPAIIEVLEKTPPSIKFS